MPHVTKITAHGKTKSSVIIEEGAQVDLRVVEPSSYGAALVYFTGSKEHNIGIRKIAVKKRFKINEYGVFNIKTDKRRSGKTEEDVYNSIGLDFIPPEMREDRGEIKASKAHKLPSLVRLKDIKGDLHVHSNFSDGVHAIEELGKICSEYGYDYIAVTDHSRSLKIAGGISEKILLKKNEEIGKINKRLKGCKLLTGTEVDIMSDGSIDYADKTLDK